MTTIRSDEATAHPVLRATVLFCCAFLPWAGLGCGGNSEPPEAGGADRSRLDGAVLGGPDTGGTGEPSGDGGAASSDPVPPATPEEAPEPTRRTSYSPATSRLVGRLESHFQHEPGRRIYIQTDRPLYRPGDWIWIKTWTLEARDLTGATTHRGLTYELVDPRGTTVAAKPVLAEDGYAHNHFAIASDMSGGRYTIRVETADGFEAEREIVVSDYRAPEVKKELEFLRRAYGPGETVVATASLRRGSDEALKNQAVEARIRIGGEVVETLDLKTDSKGNLRVKFDLPERLEHGQGILTIAVDTGGASESISRQIPLLQQQLDLRFFPEGGDLVGGLPSRVYFDANRPNGKPADLAGYVENGKGRVVARFRSFENGMGRFRLTPKPGETYRARITEPTGIDETYELPEARTRGCLLRHFDDFDGQRSATRVAIRCTSPRRVVVAAAMRNNLLDAATVRVPEQKAAVVHLEPDADRRHWQGVARVTLFDRELTPLAERLVYRRRRSRLEIDVEADHESYGPRDRVQLSIETTGPDGDPVPARLAMSVVDDTVLSLADAEMPNLMAALLLEPEVPGEIDEPNFYFELDEPRSARALDLLMGTRGYRRFRWRRVLPNGGWRRRSTAPAPRTGSRDRKRLRRGAAWEARREDRETRGEPRPTTPQSPGRVAASREVDGELPAGPASKGIQGIGSGAESIDSDALQAIGELSGDGSSEGFGGLGLQGTTRSGGGDSERGIGIGQLSPVGEGSGSGRGIGSLGRPSRRIDGRVSSPLSISGDSLFNDEWALVREFPVPDYQGERPEERTDFRDTIYWNPDLRTGDDGKTTVEFALSDEVTSFRVTTEGVGAGIPGRAETVVESTRPFSTTVRAPREVTAGDRFRIPVRLVNRRAEPVAVEVEATVDGALNRFGDWPERVPLAAGERDRVLLGMEATETGDVGRFEIGVRVGSLERIIQRKVDVEPPGIPREIAASGQLETTATREIRPEAPIPGTLRGRAKVYVNAVSSVVEAREGMLAKPHGCFEQTSSSNHPNAMLLRYLRSRGAASPKLAARAKKLMAKGYDRLTSFEVDGGGFSMYGDPPARVGLTAYGLMQFEDMRRAGAEVDTGLLRRTANWLLDQRGADGSFDGSDRNEPAAATLTAFAAFALSQTEWSGDLGSTLDRVRQQATESGDPYRLALAATTLAHLGREQLAVDARDRLVRMQNDEGAWTGAETSVTGSQGRNLDVETTALAVRALLQGDRPEPVRNGVNWLRRQRDADGLWGATQATVLSLEALEAFRDNYGAAAASSGRISAAFDGKRLETVGYDGSGTEPVTFELTDLLTPSGGAVELSRNESKGALPFSIVARYRTRDPETSPDVPIRLDVEWSSDRVELAGVVRLKVRIENRLDHRVGATLARIGLPAGLEPQLWQLKKLREGERIAFYEERPREVTLYFEGVDGESSRTVPLSLKAVVPGSFTAPPSRAYPYYNDTNVDWTEARSVEVTR